MLTTGTENKTEEDIRQEREVAEAEIRQQLSGIVKAGKLKGDIFSTAEKLKDLLRQMDATGRNGKDAESYRDFYRVLSECASLDGKKSLNEIQTAYGELIVKAEAYIETYSFGSLFRGADVRTRLNAAKEAKQQAEKAQKRQTEIAEGMGAAQQEIPLDALMIEKQKSIGHIRTLVKVELSEKAKQEKTIRTEERGEKQPEEKVKTGGMGMN